jgi:hypothetical protein
MSEKTRTDEVVWGAWAPDSPLPSLPVKFGDGRIVTVGDLTALTSSES